MRVFSKKSGVHEFVMTPEDMIKIVECDPEFLEKIEGILHTLGIRQHVEESEEKTTAADSE